MKLEISAQKATAIGTSMLDTITSLLTKTVQRLHLDQLFVFLGLALAPLMFAGSIPASAQFVDAGFSCLRHGPVSLHPDRWYRPKSLKIIPKNLPPKRVLLPGQTYNIRYEIVSRCYSTCLGLDPFYLGAYAAPLDFGGNLRSASQLLTRVRVEAHPCHETETRIIRHVAPNPVHVGASGRGATTLLTVAVCAPDVRHACALHRITVRNSSERGWQVSAPKPRQRAIGDGVNRVVGGKKVTLTARITNHTSRPLWPQSGAKLVMKQITGPRTGAADAVILPSIGAAKSYSDKFNVGPLAPGIYTFRACLQGLKDGRNYPMPEHCGPPTILTADAAGTGKWNVSPVLTNAAGKFSDKAPAGQSFRATVFINNLSVHSYGPGARFFTVWRRGAGGNAGQTIVFNGGLGAIASGRHVKKNFRLRPMTSGLYDFRACTAGTANASPVNSVCGTWSTIQIGAAKSGAGDEEGTEACTGLRTFDRVNRTCKCPANKPVWNAQARRCAAQIAVPLCSDPDRRRADGNCCPEGTVARLNRCVRLKCPEGQIRLLGKCQKAPGIGLSGGSVTPCAAGQVRVGGKCTRLPSSGGGAANLCRDGAKFSSQRGCVCRRPARWNAKSQRCVCPRGARWNGKRCIAVLTCPRGATKRGNACVCAGAAKWNAARNSCRCPRGSSWTGSRCRAVLRCPAGAKKQGNSCVCPRPQKWNKARNKCIKPAQRRCRSPFIYSAKKRACVCPRGLTRIGNSCRRRKSKRRLHCPQGARKSGTRCICARPARWHRASNRCRCPRGKTWTGRRCTG